VIAKCAAFSTADWKEIGIRRAYIAIGELSLEFCEGGGTFPSCFTGWREVDWWRSMIANRNFEQCEPLTWVGRVPVYLSTAIAFAHGVMMVFTALALASGSAWFF